MVVDKNPKASAHMDAMGLYYVPTCYMDGGNHVYVGTSQSGIASNIEQAGSYEVNDIDLELTCTWLGNAQVQVTVKIKNHQFINTPPETPAKPFGPSVGITYGDCNLSATATDPDVDQSLWYMFDFTNMVYSDWIGPFSITDTATIAHSWETTGTHYYRVKVKDSYDAETGWSEYEQIEIFKRGDANGDDGINVGDAVYIINYVFKGGPGSDPTNRGDANCDNSVNVGDAVFLINYTFKGGPPPTCGN